MQHFTRSSLLAMLVTVFLTAQPARSAPSAENSADALIAWRDWSAEVFAEAAAEGKFVLLNLEAVWCHWCHVMDQKTYANTGVAGVIEDHYIAVKVDHDARPDIANRYRNFGWPATVVFAADGTEIVKRAGFIAPDNFRRLLTAIVADPSPERAAQLELPEQFADRGVLSDSLQRTLQQRHAAAFDWDLGGLKSGIKTMYRDTTEYSMVLAAAGDAEARRMARLTIDASMALIDPSWGGAYQYSTFGDWQHPHFEKIMATQAGFLRIYALAWQQWREARYLRAARDMERFLADFLTAPEGAYYTSQDADLVQGEKGAEYFALGDSERRKLGIPRIDKNIYSRENGWAIEAVALLYEATGEQAYLDKASNAARWILAHRALPGGGFRHDAADAEEDGPYLADTLNMGRAFLQLYRAGGDRAWLQRASSAAAFIDAHFRQDGAGFLTGVPIAGPVQPLPNIDENVSAARFFNLLAHYTGTAAFRDAAEHAMRYLATPAVATRRIEEGGILLADRELARDPAHFTIIGAKDDATAQQLYALARAQSGAYKRIEWWDLSEGPLPNPDVTYPTRRQPAAFVCTDGRCSLPAFDTADFRETIARLSPTAGAAN